MVLNVLGWDGGGEPTVLFVHGYLDNAWSWTFTVEALRQGIGRGWQLLALDQRGHGESGWVGAGAYYHFADYVRDLEAVVSALGRRRLILVGHSMGALVATLWCGARPGRADGLVLVDPLGALPLEPDAFPGRFAEWLDQTVPFQAERHLRPMADPGVAAQRLRRAVPGLSVERARFLAERAIRPDGAGRWIWRYDPLHRTRSPAPLFRALVPEFCRRIGCPALWIGAGAGPWPPETVEPFLRHFDPLRRAVVEGCGHMIHQEKPELLAAHLAGFVAGAQQSWAGS